MRPQLYLEILLLVLIVAAFVRRAGRKRRHAIRMDRLIRKSRKLQPEDLARLKREAEDFQGVYVIHNESRNIYYVGQSVHVLQRAARHFSGYGNGDVYADYKYGDRFSVRFVSLKGSGYKSLDKLEKDYIERYRANESGYNRTKGNSASTAHE